MFLNCALKSGQVMLLAVASLVSSVTVMADEPVQLIEEVTVVGAVRGSSNLVVADIDVAGDESLEEMPSVYE